MAFFRCFKQIKLHDKTYKVARNAKWAWPKVGVASSPLSPGQDVDTGLDEADTLQHDGLHVLVQLGAQLDAREVRVDQQVHLREYGCLFWAV